MRTKVGDQVTVPHLAGRVLHGTVVSIDKAHLRGVMTPVGMRWATPGELMPSEEPDRTIAVRDLRPGQRVAVFSGATRVVASNTPQGSLVRIAFEQEPQQYLAALTCPPDERWHLVDR